MRLEFKVQRDAKFGSWYFMDLDSLENGFYGTVEAGNVAMCYEYARQFTQATSGVLVVTAKRPHHRRSLKVTGCGGSVYVKVNGVSSALGFSQTSIQDYLVSKNIRTVWIYIR